MSVFFSLAEIVLREGLVYSLMAMGVYITYKILDFPDLSVDGTFPLGACVAAALLSFGANHFPAPWQHYGRGWCASLLSWRVRPQVVSPVSFM